MLGRRVAVLGAVCAAFGVPALIRSVRDTRLDRVPIPGAGGFYWIDGGAVSTAGQGAALVGLEAPLPKVDVCAALFDTAADGVPAAYFSDIRCPYCRALERDLAPLAASGRIALTRHELPVFGAISEAGARAIVAARAQGAEAEVRARVERAFRPSLGYLRDLAGDVGIDPDRFIADMDAPQTQAALSVARSLARQLGIVGTPGLVVGDTVSMGTLSPARLERVIADAGPPPCA